MATPEEGVAPAPRDTSLETAPLPLEERPQLRNSLPLSDSTKTPPGKGELARFYKTSEPYRDHLAAKPEAHFSRYIAMVRRFAPPGAHILEVGCGAGQAARALTTAGYRVTATDLSPLFLAAARREGRAGRNESPDYLAADIQRLPFPDRTFDAVAACELIEHVADPAAALDEFARVVRMKGWILIRSPALASPVWPLLDLPNLLRGGGGRPPHYATMAEAARFLTANIARTGRILCRRRPAFERRAPDLSHDSVGGDSDAAYWSSPVEIARHLRAHGFRIAQQAERPAHWAPWLSPTIALAARREIA